jgi:hypothetical protein
MNSTVQRLNSLVPVTGNATKNAVNVGIQNVASNFTKNANAVTNGVKNGVTNAIANNVNSKSGYSTPLLIFVALLLVFLGIFAYFYEPLMDSLQNWTDSINMYFTGRGGPPAPITESEPSIPTEIPKTPEEDANTPATGASAIVERILPPAKDVFTVSKNNYTYYDAAPLCKALGAELATYEQVKNAWQGGADWCNYGWVKGQMAVYPTQQGTYEELQQGPAEQRGACGKPGLNGGYFDNPELKFGVTCVGKKPTQSQHDATTITSGATRPLTASGLEFENKVQQFREEADTVGILPFNKERWN